MKDTNNKVEHNVWSCGEYNQNYNGFTPGSDAILQPTKEFSSIGETSLKIVRKHELYGTSCSIIISNLTGTNNITATLAIYSPNNPTQIHIVDGTTVTSAVNCPASPTVSIVSLTATVTSNSVEFRIYLNQPNHYVFVDNINIQY